MKRRKIIEKSLQKLHTWLYDLEEFYGTKDITEALIILRHVLQGIRDNMPVQIATNFGAQLPLFIKAFYYENWTPSHTPTKDRQDGAFWAALKKRFAAHPEIDVPKALDAALQTMAIHLPKDLLCKIKSVFPKKTREIFEQAISEKEKPSFIHV